MSLSHPNRPSEAPALRIGLRGWAHEIAGHDGAASGEISDARAVGPASVGRRSCARVVGREASGQAAGASALATVTTGLALLAADLAAASRLGHVNSFQGPRGVDA